MIEYQYNEEKDFALYYANELGRPLIVSILNRGFVETGEEARALSDFFWEMVDKTIEEEKLGELNKFNENSKFWTEKLLQTFSGHLEATGFSNIWDEVVDNQ